MTTNTCFFELPALPFERHSLEPEISRVQIDRLYSYFHRNLINRLNTALSYHRKDKGCSILPLEQLQYDSESEIATSAATLLQMTYYWHSLSAHPINIPEAILHSIKQNFTGINQLKSALLELMEKKESGAFWLVSGWKNELKLVHTKLGAAIPNEHVLLCILLFDDMLQLDYPNNPNAYLNAIWPHLNWEFSALQHSLIE